MLGAEGNLRRRSRHGAAAVEFALILPVVALLLMGLMEFAMIGHHKLSLVQGARAGAREASIGSPLTAVINKVRQSTPNAKVIDEEIRVEYNTADDGSGEWVAATNSENGKANAVPFGRLIRVRIVNWPHTLLTGSFFGWLPGVSNGKLPLNAEMVMRRE